MTHVGIDYGRKRTGFAMEVSGTVIPLEPLDGTTWNGILSRLEDIRGERGAISVVLGLPLSASGRPTELSREVEELADYLSAGGFPVETVDETGSTEEAVRVGIPPRKRDGRSDSLAAMIILKRYLAIP